MELNTSKLGTKEYWCQYYAVELENYTSFKDSGHIWFGIDSAERMIDWTIDNVPQVSTVLDLGTGNGHLLTGLYENGFRNLTGYDYSADSVALASKISESLDCQIDFKTVDFLNDKIDGRFDILLDKGTFDAISLSEGPRAQQYVDAVGKLLNQDGLLLITSCNWTQSELIEWFGSTFTLHDKIKYPTFKFGGVEGQQVTTLIFKLK